MVENNYEISHEKAVDVLKTIDPHFVKEIK